MSLVEVLKIIVLGIVEGFTEWLPISSTGHMILVDEIIRLNQPDAFKDETGLTIFKNLLKAYFDNGGLHVQVSCQDINQLIDAKAHPEKHRDLMVRVTGYSGIFVDMARHVQDYVIERMKK